MRLIAFVGIFALGALAANVLFAHAPARFAIDLAQPLTVATWWGSYGGANLTILIATLALAFIPYVLMLRSQTPPLRVTLAACVLTLLAALLWHPLFSSDVYAYAAYGEMARLGVDPYVHATAPLVDPLVRDAQWQWSGSLPICVYGSAFVVLARTIVAAFSSFGALAQLEAFRILACCAFLLAAALLAFCTNAGDDRGRRAAAFLALNPVAIWCAAEGHNDTLMIALGIAGIAVTRRMPAIGTFIATSAALVKAPALASGGALAAIAWIQKRTFAPAIGFVAALLLVGVAALPLLHGVTRDLAPHGRYLPLVSVQSLHPLVAILVALLLAMQIPRMRTTLDRLLLVALILWLAIPNPYPWYSLWLLPLAAWATDRAAVTTGLLVTAIAVLRYLPDAVAIPSGTTALALGVVALLGYTPLLTRAIISRP